jgi:uncharacterized Fe-S cluster-containing radical SAM superfamily protein
MDFATLDSDALAKRYRANSLRVGAKEILIARIAGSEQEGDLTLAPNCDGYGRIRHFRSKGGADWTPNPLPVEPALKALGLPPSQLVRAQAFQNAACNWRCWYCYVPFNLLTADEFRGRWWTPSDLVAWYAGMTDRPPVIDLTGGQPDLVPEWIPWTMEALREQDLADRVYLWSEDNLSNDYFWRYLSTEQIELVAGWPLYGRVGCFKGFDAASFSFNTAAAPELFDRQFELFRRFLALGVDAYAYVTLTAPTAHGIAEAMPRFVDRLQAIHPNLPLRTVPLEIAIFSPVRKRMRLEHHAALDHQRYALDAFRKELEARFSSALRETPICDVPLSKGRAARP